MSLPAEKTVSWPWMTTARTATSWLADSSASASALYMSAVMEFLRATRFSVIVITPASTWVRISGTVEGVMSNLFQEELRVDKAKV